MSSDQERKVACVREAIREIDHLSESIGVKFNSDDVRFRSAQRAIELYEQGWEPPHPFRDTALKIIADLWPGGVLDEGKVIVAFIKAYDEGYEVGYETGFDG